MLTSLWDMAAETEAAVPAVLYTSKKKAAEDVGRHYEAVRMIESGQLSFWGNLPSGPHRFWVNGHEVIYETNSCDCWDHSRGAPVHEGYRLCKHMLAAQYWLQARVQLQAEFERIIDMAKRLGLSKIALVSRVYFVHNDRMKGGVQENVLTGYRLDAMPLHELTGDDEFTFYNLDLHRALLSHGWMVERGRVGGTFMGSKEVWSLTPAPADEPDMLPMDKTRIWRLDGATEASIERRNREKVFLESFEYEMNKNLLAIANADAGKDSEQEAEYA